MALGESCGWFYGIFTFGLLYPTAFFAFFNFLIFRKITPRILFFFFDFSIEQQNKFLSLLQAYLIVAAAVDFVAAY